MTTLFGSVQEKLQDMIKQGRTPHAQLLIAQEGTPALPLALVLIQTLHCTSLEKPCKQCAACTRVHEQVHPDLHHIFPLGKNAVLKGKEVTLAQLFPTFQAFCREMPFGGLAAWATYMGCEAKQMSMPKETITHLRSILQHTPFDGQVKTILVWLPECLNRIAANTMLKMVEEPTHDTFFIFITHDLHSMLPTLRSRMWPIYLPALSKEEVLHSLQASFPSKQASELAHAATLAGGNLHKAIQVAKGNQLNYFTSFSHWLRCLYAHKEDGLMALAEEFHEYPAATQRNWLQYGSQLLQQAFHARVGMMTVPKETATEERFCHKLGQTLSPNAFQALLQGLSTMHKHIGGHAHAKLTFLAHSLALSDEIKH